MSVFVLSSFSISVSVYNKRYTDTRTFSRLLCVCTTPLRVLFLLLCFSFCKHYFFRGQMQMYILVSLPFSLFVYFSSSCGNYFFLFKSVFMFEHQQNWGVSVFMCVCVCVFLVVLSAALFCPLTDVCVYIYIGVGYCDVSC